MIRFLILTTLLFLSSIATAEDFNVAKIKDSYNLIEYKKYVSFYSNNNIPEEEVLYYFYFKSYIENSKGNYIHSNNIINNNFLLKDNPLKGSAFNLKGKNNFQLNKNKEAIDDFNQALSIFNKKKSLLNAAKTSVSLSEVYFKLSFFNKALLNLKTVVHNIKEINDKDLIINVYQLMGNIYSELYLFDEAREAYVSAINLINNNHSLNYTFISNIYYKYSKNEVELKNITEAKKYTKKGLNICKMENDSSCIIKFKLLESKMHLCNSLFEESLYALNEAETFVDEFHEEYKNLLLQKFKIYFLKKDVAKIETIIQQITKINDESFLNTSLYQKTMYEYYSLKGDIPNAFIYLEKYHNSYKDKYKNNLLNRISELKTVLDFEVELQKNNSLEKINKQNELVIKQQSKINKWQSVAIITILILCFFMILLAVKTIKNKKEIKKMADIDPLTGLKNRRAISEISSRLYNSNNEFSVILFDIDNFKNINDTYGHQTGDDVLKEISKVSKNSLRDSDHLGRYGGEEFIIFLPNCNIKKAKEIAERVRQDIENIDYSTIDEELVITSSFGVSVNDSNLGLKDIIAEADKKLYLAKDQGRNRVN